MSNTTLSAAFYSRPSADALRAAIAELESSHPNVGHFVKVAYVDDARYGTHTALAAELLLEAVSALRPLPQIPTTFLIASRDALKGDTHAVAREMITIRTRFPVLYQRLDALIETHHLDPELVVHICQAVATLVRAHRIASRRARGEEPGSRPGSRSQPTT